MCSEKNIFSVISLALFGLISSFTFAVCPSADLTGDCFVDYEDFALMGGQWLNGYDYNDLTEMANQWLLTDPNSFDDLNMVFIGGGEFEMGRHVGDGYSDEVPLHAALVDSFFMGKYEATNGQYCQYLNSALGSSIYVSGGIVYGSGNNQPYCDTSTSSSYSQIDYSGGVFSVMTKPEVGGRDMSDDPVVMVSWYGAASYCNWQSSEEGYESCYDLSTWDCDFTKKGYRLATEAEWEYAARGGEHSPYYRFGWGDTISHSQANYESFWQGGSPYYPYDVSLTEGYHPIWDDGIDPYTASVGSFSPNGYGLYDMSGNVFEWCNDWYYSYYYNVSPYDNPQGPAFSPNNWRVVRGGSWRTLASPCRVAFRSGYNPDDPDDRSYGLGFRVVLPD